MSQHEDEVALTLSTEQRLFPAARVLTDAEAAGMGKTLLVRPTAAPLPSRARVSLGPVATEQDWHDYTRARVEVEAGFGIGREDSIPSARACRNPTVTGEPFLRGHRSL